MKTHFEDQIEEYLSGTLSARAQMSFEQHIEGCRSCCKALEETQDARAYLQWLVPLEKPPEPGPEFYSKIQRSIEKKIDSSWTANLAAMLQGPRVAYPLLLLLGLLLAAWGTTLENDWGDAGVLGIPPARYTVTISSEADRLRSRDMVMVSLVDSLEDR